MAKILSGLTLIIALVATFFGFQSKDRVATLQEKFSRTHTDLEETRGKLKKSEEKLKVAEDDLKVAKDDLTKAQADLVTAKAEADKATAEATDAKAKLADAETQLAAAKKIYDDLKEKLGGKPPEEILKAVTDLETEKKDLAAKVAEAEIAVTKLKQDNENLIAAKKDFDEKLASRERVIKRYQEGIVRKGLTGRVLAVNAGWGFCVLSIGDRQGAAANKVMVVVRDGQAIGKVKVISVEASQSVADIIKSSFVRGAYVEPGDTVIYTGDEKVREEPVTPSATTAPLGPVLPGGPDLPLR